jgi:hypothetical protein
LHLLPSGDDSSPEASGGNGGVGAGVCFRGEVAMGSEWERPGEAGVNSDSWETAMAVAVAEVFDVTVEVIDVTRGLRGLGLILNGAVNVGFGFPHKLIDGVSFIIGVAEGKRLMFDGPAEMIGFGFGFLFT